MTGPLTGVWGSRSTQSMVSSFILPLHSSSKAVQRTRRAQRVALVKVLQVRARPPPDNGETEDSADGSDGADGSDRWGQDAPIEGWATYHLSDYYAPRKDVEYHLIAAEKEDHHEGVPALIREVKALEEENLLRGQFEILVMKHLLKGVLVSQMEELREMHRGADELQDMDTVAREASRLEGEFRAMDAEEEAEEMRLLAEETRDGAERERAKVVCTVLAQWEAPELGDTVLSVDEGEVLELPDGCGEEGTT